MSYWTSEAVSCGHPDKLADQVADAVLDAYLSKDAEARVACEVTLTSHLAFVTGEIGSIAKIDLENVVRGAICKAGYDNDSVWYNGNTVSVYNALKRQSREIANAVIRSDGEIGAGDQGMMFGFATREFLPTLMPLAHQLAMRIINHQESLVKGDLGLYPDAKSQVTLRYKNGVPVDVDTVVLSTQHSSEVSLDRLKSRLYQEVLGVLSRANEEHCSLGGESFITSLENTRVLINPAGPWSVGGPVADTGLSGRKIVVDNYGSDCPIGGGSFSGKDPTKVDRSAAYAARHLAKNIVANGLANKCQVQVSYAIGVAEPISVRLQTFGTGKMSDSDLETLVRQKVSLTPRAIIDRLQLRRPIYSATASGGHFGREGLPWELVDLKL